MGGRGSRSQAAIHDAVAQTAERSERVGSATWCSTTRVLRGSPRAQRPALARSMPATPHVARATAQSRASTARWASRMQAGTPTPSNAAPAIASPGTVADRGPDRGDPRRVADQVLRQPAAPAHQPGLHRLGPRQAEQVGDVGDHGGGEVVVGPLQLRLVAEPADRRAHQQRVPGQVRPLRRRHGDALDQPAGRPAARAARSRRRRPAPGRPSRPRPSTRTGCPAAARPRRAPRSASSRAAFGAGRGDEHGVGGQQLRRRRRADRQLEAGRRPPQRVRRRAQPDVGAATAATSASGSDADAVGARWRTPGRRRRRGCGRRRPGRRPRRRAPSRAAGSCAASAGMVAASDSSSARPA